MTQAVIDGGLDFIFTHNRQAGSHCRLLRLDHDVDGPADQSPLPAFRREPRDRTCFMALNPWKTSIQAGVRGRNMDCQYNYIQT